MGYPKEPRANRAKRPHPGVPHDPQVINELITKHRGNISKVADAVGTDRSTIQKLVTRHPHLQETLAQARERRIDAIEDSVFDRAEDSNDTQLQQFVLKTQARNRGWEPAAVTDKADIAIQALAFIMNQSKNPAEAVNGTNQPPAISNQ